MVSQCQRWNALILHPSDNVAVLLNPVEVNEEIHLSDGAIIVAQDNIPFGHKCALKLLKAGDVVLKHGVPIGAVSRDILPGQNVHLHNLQSLQWEEFL